MVPLNVFVCHGHLSASCHPHTLKSSVLTVGQCLLWRNGASRWTQSATSCDLGQIWVFPLFKQPQDFLCPFDNIIKLLLGRRYVEGPHHCTCCRTNV